MSDVVVPALLVPIPVLSLVLLVYNTFVCRSTHAKRAMCLLLAVFPATASGAALSVVYGAPLGTVAKVSTVLLHTTLSGISIYALFQTPAFPPPFLRVFLSFVAFLLACEFISALIPTSPLLLSATFALVSRGILLTLAMITAILLRYRRVTESNIEKGHLADDSPGKTPGRVSSPTQATWPFPGSLALHHQSEREIYPSEPTPLGLLSSSTTSRTLHVAKGTCQIDRQIFILLPLVLVIAQIFATLAAGLSVAACMLVDAATNQFLPRVLLADATCTLLWSLTVLATIQVLPINNPAYSSEMQVADGYKQNPANSSHGGLSQTPKPSLVRRQSDSILDFLSLRDPFASLPPSPPPLPPVGLGLDEVDVGWSRNKEIGMQYRFPAPRSIVRGGRRKGKNSGGNKSLAHQDSSRTLLPVPEARGTEADVDKDKGFDDEARLAQLLLQSLDEGEQDSEDPGTSIPAPIVQTPQAVHVQQISRWSTSTTVRSAVSASVSNKSGVSTYTTCASERVPPSRISMNTIASVLGSRKSSEAKRKSATIASSPKD